MNKMNKVKEKKMSEKKLILLGAGDLSREIMAAATEPHESTAGTKYETIAFIDDDPSKIGTKHEGISVISFADVKKWLDEDVYFISGLGIPGERKSIVKKLLDIVPDAKFANVIHHSAVIVRNAKIEEGVYIGPNATIAIGCLIKSHTVLNFNVSIGHDCTIHPYSVVSPGCLLSGFTEVGEETFLGSGVITYPGVRIGKNCAVSAGVVVARNLPEAKRMILKPNTMIIPVENP